MAKKIKKVLLITLCVIGIVLSLCLTVYARTSIWEEHDTDTELTTQTDEEPVIPVDEQVFDTDPLLEWGGDPQQGVLRMIGGMYYGVDDEGYTLVVDEEGHVWSIYQDIDEEDFLLLWIVDNNTVNCYDDDVVVKVWREAY